MEQHLTRIRQRPDAIAWLRLFLALAGLLFSQGAMALAPSLEHYSRSVWTSKDGLPAAIRVMAQTTDGWLWLGTPNGLYRFDGVQFYPLAASNGESLLSSGISALRADANGALYIGYEDHGLSVLHADGRLEHLAPAGKDSPVASTLAILPDIDGTLWTGTARGLMHFEHGRWTRLGAAEGYPESPTGALNLDAGGRLWAASIAQLSRYERAQRRFVAVDLAYFSPDMEAQHAWTLAMAPDGRLWRVAVGGRFTPLPTPTEKPRPRDANSRAGSHFGMFDRDGHLWALRCPAGICLASGAVAGSAAPIDMQTAASSRFDQPWQLGSLSPNVMLEDMEGNIWLGGKGSLERFRKNVLTPIALPTTTGTYHIAPDPDGSAWIVAPLNRSGWRYDPASRRLAFLPEIYRGAARGANGSVALLKESGIVRRDAGAEESIALPALPPGAWVRTDGERIWLGGAGIPARIWDGRTWETLLQPTTEEFTFSAAGKTGQMWRGLVDGRLLLFEGTRIAREIKQEALGDIGQFTGLSAVPELVVCGEAGVAAWDGRRFRRLHATNPKLLNRVSGVLVTADGARWLNGSAGLLRVDAADWRRSLEQGVPLHATLFDVLDGYTGVADNAPSLTLVGNRIWAATTGGMVEIDPAARERNRIAPRVALLGLSGDDTAYALSTPTISAGTMRVRVDFTAPSLRKPERVVFSFRLDGVDEAWQTGSERSATYTGLAPGAYLFRVRAMNEDGVWSERERTLAFEVAPTLVQTMYFKLACALGVLLLLWLGYRLRLRYLTRILERRHQVQLDERARIARELHDSLLQNFQGAVLEMRTVLSGLDAGSQLHARLHTGVHEANAAIAEGREKVEALRNAAADQVSLPDYLRQVGEDVAGPGQQFSLRVEGVVRALQPVVEQELCAIGREALRNAFRHAQAGRHEVVVAYGVRNLVLCISDDGCGMGAGARDKPGHWGLLGIEERARLIRARVELQTAPEEGTRWRITVKARVAYLDGRWGRNWDRVVR